MSGTETLAAAEKRRAYRRKYYLEHREEVLARNRRYANLDAKRAASRKWGQQNRGKILEAKFGITLEEHDALLQAQGFRCAICGADNPRNKRTKRFAVDHCHETGKVRGLLCARCNTAIGLLGDDPARAMAVAKYLKQSAEPTK